MTSQVRCGCGPGSTDEFCTETRVVILLCSSAAPDVYKSPSMTSSFIVQPEVSKIVRQEIELR